VRSTLAWLAACAWMAGILYTSSQGQAATPVSGWLQTLVSKTGHVLEYAALGVMLMAAVRRETRASTLAALAVVVAIGVTFASLDETRQSFVPGREPRPTDVLLDTVSLGAAAWLFARASGGLRADASSGAAGSSVEKRRRGA
jgi:VanZ family protein